MADTTEIAWTDRTFNPWEGCTKVSPGCAHCYAENRNKRFAGGANWGKGAPRRRTVAANWKNPLRWNKATWLECLGCGWRGSKKAVEATKKCSTIGLTACPECDTMNFKAVRQRVFCASLADWLDDEVPIEWLADLLELIWKTPNLDWLLLTKRPENFKERIAGASLVRHEKKDDAFTGWLNLWYLGIEMPQNIWAGTTVENQEMADKRIPLLLDIPSKVRFLSCEPLLGALDVSKWLGSREERYSAIEKEWIRWVICGGESGKEARPMNPDHASRLFSQCLLADVPFLFKQWGEWVGGRLDTRKGKAVLEDGTIFWRNPEHPEIHIWGQTVPGSPWLQLISAKVGKKTRKLPTMGEAVRMSNNALLDGFTHNEFPEVVR